MALFPTSTHARNVPNSITKHATISKVRINRFDVWRDTLGHSESTTLAEVQDAYETMLDSQVPEPVPEPEFEPEP